MTFAALASLRDGLGALARDGLLRDRRVVASAQGPHIHERGRILANFASNDYLGLANHPEVRDAATRAIEAYGVGAGASPLVVGHSTLHDEAESAIARFVGAPRALLFGSGYAANLGILAALGNREADIFADRLNHACLNDGALLARATLKRYPHGDLDRLASMLVASTARTKIIATDAVFSMDGDVADVEALTQLAEKYDAWLVVDDAHGIGVLGGGRGTLAERQVRSPRLICMATLGKALGGYGAFVTAEADVIEWLLQRARTYVFSTALPPAMAAAATAALAIIEREPERVQSLHANIDAFRRGCEAVGIETPSRTAIHPVIVGDAQAAVGLAQALGDRGHWVPAIRPPTVPEATARLRVSLSAAHSRHDIDRLIADLAECRTVGTESGGG